MDFPHGSDGKESTFNVGDPGLIPGSGRSPGEGSGNPLQYSCLENPHRRRSLVGYSPQGRKESTWLRDFTFIHKLQHARPPCLSPTPGVYPNSCPSSRWCHPAISSSCRPLLLLPPIPPSIRVFSNESTLRMRWPKYWSFSFSISPSNEHPGLISFRMDWLDLLAVQGTLKSLLQHHSSKASILRHSSFLHSPTLASIHDHRKNHSLD